MPKMRLLEQNKSQQAIYRKRNLRTQSKSLHSHVQTVKDGNLQEVQKHNS
jgi:hypothetical protein